VFQKFRDLGSARQVLLWMASQNIHFSYPPNGRTLTSFEWRPIRYRNVISILKNPFYAGVYAYGKSEKRTSIVDGRARELWAPQANGRMISPSGGPPMSQGRQLRTGRASVYIRRYIGAVVIQR
jgi:hypothetical protein